MFTLRKKIPFSFNKNHLQEEIKTYIETGKFSYFTEYKQLEDALKQLPQAVIPANKNNPYFSAS